MKKIIITAVILFCGVFASAGSSEAKQIVRTDIGLSSGIPFYGGSSVTDGNDRVNDGDYNRIIIGVNAAAAFRLAEPIRLLVGADTLCDFIWSGSDYSNHLDYAFYLGLKFYPGIGGLNSSIAYALGRRTDFLNNEVEDTVIHSSAWGNGFRISLEYDFSYGHSYAAAPALGMYYRCMPRGSNTYDNILAAYVSFSF